LPGDFPVAPGNPLRILADDDPSQCGRARNW
jgi:hypothetical protein